MRRRSRPFRQCAICGDFFELARSDARYCSIACKQKAYRLRVTDSRNANIFREQNHGSKKKALTRPANLVSAKLPSASGCETRARTVRQLIPVGLGKFNTPAQRLEGQDRAERGLAPNKVAASSTVTRDTLRPKATARLRPTESQRAQGHPGNATRLRQG